MTNIPSSQTVSFFLKSSLISFVTASFLLVGCSTKNTSLKKDDLNSTIDQNNSQADANQTLQHTSAFQIQKGFTADAIFGQLSKIDGKTYIIKKDDDFKVLYSSNKIESFEDVKEFVELHDYKISAKSMNKYTLIELSKNENKMIEKLLKTKVSIKGTLPLSVAVSELTSQIGIGYSFDKTLAGQMSKINHFYYEGDAKEAFEHIAQKSEVEVGFSDNKVLLQKYATAFVSVDLPLKNRSLATNIINNISSATAQGGTTSSAPATTTAEDTTASSDGFDVTIQGSDKQSIVEAYNQFIIKELVMAIKSTLTKEGTFHYIPTSGQIMLKDKAENVKDAVRLVNNFNDKFKERIDVEFKFYKLTSNDVRKRGINLTGMLNDKIAATFTPYSSTATGALNLNFNDGKTNAILNMLNQIGKTEVENTITMYNQSNIINVEKVSSNFGYIQSIDTTTNTNGNIANDVTPGSVPDGTFFAVLANGMSGQDIGINYFLSFNNLVNFMTHTTTSTSIQTPNTAEQSYSNTKIVQSGIPYVISSYRVKSNRSDKTSLPLIEDTFLDTVTGTKNTDSDDTYIIVTMKAVKRL